MALALFFGLAQGITVTAIYTAVAANTGHGPGAACAFLITLMMAWGCGAWWWGKSIDGESSLAPRMLALTQVLASLIWLAWPWLLPVSGWLGAIFYPWSRPEPGPALLLGEALALVPLLAPAAFFNGGILPLLAEMGLKKRVMLEWNLPLIGGLWLAGLAGGAATAFSGLAENSHMLWGGLGFTFLVAIIPLIIGEKPERDEYSGPARMRLWPSRSLGLWSGDAINVIDHDLTKSAARPAWLITFMASLAGAGSISLWAGHFSLTGLSVSFEAMRQWIIFVPAAMALGNLFLAPQLSRLASSSSSLAIGVMLLAAGLLVCPLIWNNVNFIAGAGNFFDIPAFWILVWPLAVLGALWPLAAQVFQGRRQWLASSLGLAAFWCCAGASAGLLLTHSGLLLFHQAAAVYTIISLMAGALALAPLFGWAAAIIIGGGITAAVVALWSPEQLSPEYLSERSQKMAPSGQQRFYTEGPEIDLAVFEFTDGREQVLINGRPLNYSERDLAVAAMIVDGFLEAFHPGSRGSATLAPVLAADSRGLDGLDLGRLGRGVTAAGPAALYPGLDGQAHRAGPRIIADEPRHYLSLTREEYALIISGPLDNSLATYDHRGLDFYRLAKQHLMKQGIMVQMLDINTLSTDEIRREMQAMARVFSQVSYWNPGEGNLAFLMATPAWISDDRWLNPANLDRWQALSQDLEIDAAREAAAALRLAPEHLLNY